MDALKTLSTDLSVMRASAMRFRGILGGRDGTRLEPWLDDACHSGIYALHERRKVIPTRFAMLLPSLRAIGVPKVRSAY